MKCLIQIGLRVSACILLSSGVLIAQDTSAQLDKLFLEVTSNPDYHFNGVVLVADGDKIIYQNATGYADLSNQQKNSIQTRFQLASLSKVFTATAVMQLAEKGLIQLNDPLVKYLSAFPYPDITIRQILSHTSGLPDFNEVYREKSKHALNNSDIIPALIQFGPLATKPGCGMALFQHGLCLARQSGGKDIRTNFSGIYTGKYLQTRRYAPFLCAFTVYHARRLTPGNQLHIPWSGSVNSQRFAAYDFGKSLANDHWSRTDGEFCIRSLAIF